MRKTCYRLCDLVMYTHGANDTAVLWHILVYFSCWKCPVPDQWPYINGPTPDQRYQYRGVGNRWNHGAFRICFVSLGDVGNSMWS